MAGEGEGDSRLELTVFRCKELYIYKVPPASTIGHRAELWDVDHWLQEVSMEIVTRGEACSIKLYDLKTGAFFAECPVPNPGVAPLTTAVDPVVDSSRYFVLKLLDADTGRHAFIGIGFRERGQASDFNAAISEHLAYVRRAREAEQMREAFAGREAGDGAGPSSGGADLSLKPGETITLRLGGKAVKRQDRSDASGGSPAASVEPGKPPPLQPPPLLPPPGAQPWVAAPAAAPQQDDWGDFGPGNGPGSSLLAHTPQVLAAGKPRALPGPAAMSRESSPEEGEILDAAPVAAEPAGPAPARDEPSRTSTGATSSGSRETGELQGASRPASAPVSEATSNGRSADDRRREGRSSGKQVHDPGGGTRDRDRPLPRPPPRPAGRLPAPPPRPPSPRRAAATPASLASRLKELQKKLTIGEANRNADAFCSNLKLALQLLSQIDELSQGGGGAGSQAAAPADLTAAIFAGLRTLQILCNTGAGKANLLGNAAAISAVQLAQERLGLFPPARQKEFQGWCAGNKVFKALAAGEKPPLPKPKAAPKPKPLPPQPKPKPKSMAPAPSSRPGSASSNGGAAGQGQAQSRPQPAGEPLNGLQPASNGHAAPPQPVPVQAPAQPPQPAAVQPPATAQPDSPRPPQPSPPQPSKTAFRIKWPGAPARRGGQSNRQLAASLARFQEGRGQAAQQGQQNGEKAARQAVPGLELEEGRAVKRSRLQPAADLASDDEADLYATPPSQPTEPSPSAALYQQEAEQELGPLPPGIDAAEELPPRPAEPRPGSGGPVADDELEQEAARLFGGEGLEAAVTASQANMEAVRALLRQGKLCLVLDLDHTLVNSARWGEVAPADASVLEEHLEKEALLPPDQRSLHSLEGAHMWTKLRPLCRQLLAELASRFVMWIHTNGNRQYAAEVCAVLDPTKELFGDRVVANAGLQPHDPAGAIDLIKRLDAQGLAGLEPISVIVDDTASVWPGHSDNLLLVERYCYFPSSARQLGAGHQSLLALRRDERAEHGMLSVVRRVLLELHAEALARFAAEERGQDAVPWDVRCLLQELRSQVLQGVRICFSRLWPMAERSEEQHLWRLALALGAECSTVLDARVTHVVTNTNQTDKARMARAQGKWVVHARWLEGSSVMWARVPEASFPVRD